MTTTAERFLTRTETGIFRALTGLLRNAQRGESMLFLICTAQWAIRATLRTTASLTAATFMTRPSRAKNTADSPQSCGRLLQSASRAIPPLQCTIFSMSRAARLKSRASQEESTTKKCTPFFTMQSVPLTATTSLRLNASGRLPPSPTPG